MTDRKEILNKLINFDESIGDLKKYLKKLCWDSDEELIIMRNQHLVHIFDLFSKGKIDINMLEEWANLIEGREDIGFQDETLKEIIFELSNPVLFGDINDMKIEYYKDKMT